MADLPDDVERKARVTAQFDQIQAEGDAWADDPEVADAIGAWMQATERAALVLLKCGVPPAGLLSALLGPTADLVVAVRDRAIPDEPGGTR